MKIKSITISVDEHQAWWVEVLSAGDMNVKVGEGHQVLRSTQLASDKFLMLSNVKGEQHYGGEDMKVLHEAVNLLVETRVKPKPQPPDHNNLGSQWR